MVLRHVIQHLKLEFSKILPDRGFDLGVRNSKLFKIFGVYHSDKCICRDTNMLQMKHFESQSRCGTVDVFNALSLTNANFMDLLTAWLRKQLWKMLTHGWWYHKWGNIIPIVGAVVVRHSKLKPTKSVAGEDYVPDNRRTWDKAVSVRIDEEIPLSGCNQTALGVGLSRLLSVYGHGALLLCSSVEGPSTHIKRKHF